MLEITQKQCEASGVNGGVIPTAMRQYITALCDPKVGDQEVDADFQRRALHVRVGRLYEGSRCQNEVGVARMDAKVQQRCAVVRESGEDETTVLNDIEVSWFCCSENATLEELFFTII